MKNTHKKLLKFILLGLGVFLFYWIIRYSGNSFLELLKRTVGVKHYFLIAAILTMFVQSVLVAKRWSILMSVYTDIHSLPRGFVFYNTNIGFLVTSFLPVFGYIGAKAASCKVEHNISIRKTVFATSVEYWIGGTVILAMLIPSVLYLFHILGTISGLIGIFVVLLILFTGFSRYYMFTMRMIASSQTALTRKLNRISFLKGRVKKDLFDPKAFMKIDKKTSTRLISLTVATYFTILVRNIVYLQAFNIDVNISEFILIYSLGYTLSSLGLTPGNLGVEEFGWFGVLMIIGADQGNAVQFAVGQRIINLGATVLIALISYVYYLVQKRQNRSPHTLKSFQK